MTPTDPKDVPALRLKAEKLLREAPEERAPTPGIDVQRLIHELTVHEIELEMQNDELRRSQEQLEGSRSEYADLYDFAPVGYLTLNQKGLVTRANLTACAFLGTERGHLITKPFALFIHPESQDLFYLHKREVLKTTTAQTCQLVLIRKDVTSFDAQLVSIAAQVNGATVIRTVLTDITERRKTEKELVMANRKLQQEMEKRRNTEQQLRQSQKMEAIGTLTGGIAHDFNNILAVIIGFAELANEKLKEGSRERRHLQKVFEAGLRARDLIKRMLIFSRQTEQDKKPLRLSSIVKETMKLLRASIPTTIMIKTDVRGESSLVLADPIQIQQVLMNLCMNAAHAMQERGGILHVELSDFSVSEPNANPHGIKPGLYIKLMVRDTGTGISPDIIEKIFDPFFTTKEKGGGTGLGLSVIHGIVKQHAGYITVESEQGEGATFTIYFPTIPEKPETDAVDEKTIPTGHERILFVDDEEALAEIGEAILTDLGYEVESRISSGEALAFFRLDPFRFDLVITDGTMPELTGIQLAKEIMAVRSDIPIILCSGFDQPVDADTAGAAGIKAVSIKPFTKMEIAKTIRKVLDE